MLTSVIIPCWNAVELTRVCLTQLARHTSLPYELIAIDNGSTDDTSSWLSSFQERHGAPSRMRVLRNRQNLGYPAAMNQGIAAARGELILFGNNDAAPGPEWLEGMHAALAARTDVGGVSPCSNPPRGPSARKSWSARPWYSDTRGLERFVRASLLNPGLRAFYPSECFVPGFWFLTKRVVLDRVGGFDERYYPGGFEDWDLQWRMREAGYAIGFAGRAYAHHQWFGCSGRNGLSEIELYSGERRRILSDKFPGSAALGMEVRAFTGS